MTFPHDGADILFTYNGYVAAMREPYVEVVLTQIEGGVANERVLMPYDLFQDRGLAYQGARFIFQLRRYGEERIPVVEFDPAWEKVADLDAIRAQLDRDLQETAKELEEVMYD